VWRWITQLFTPFEATKEQLAGATANGVSFGRVLGEVLMSVITGVTWLAKGFTAVGTAIGTAAGWIVVHGGQLIDWLGSTWSTVSEAIKAPFVTAFQWIADKIDSFMERWRALKAKLGIHDETVVAAGLHWNTGADDDVKPPARFTLDNRPPLRAGGGGSITNHNQYSVTVQAMPGHEDAAARAASAELDRRERAKAAASRSRLGDTE